MADMTQSYKPKIAVLHPEFIKSGGAERKLLLIINSLKERYNFTVFTHKVDKKKCFPEFIKDVNFVMAEYSKTLFGKAKAVYSLSKKVKGFDLIHANNFPSNISAVLAKFRYKTPILWFCNEPILYLNDTIQRENSIKLFFYRFFERLLVKKIDMVIANSKNTAENIKKSFDINPAVIYSGIDTEKYLIKNKKQNKILSIFLISRIEKHKQIDFLIDVSKKLQRNVKFDLIIAGAGDYLESLKKRVKDENLGFVKLLGAVSEERKIELYRMSDVFAFPTKDEPLGVTPLEAMSCGVPVIAFNSGGPKETIKHNVTGFLANNEGEYKKYLNTLLIDSDLRTKFGKSGRLRVFENFSVEQMIKKTEEKYTELIK